ncbi:hypothetical protein D2N39_12715 [Gemmobacter lutimaris]|uniref:Uncharacterized protein n=1 Tax=Gemmobacter lutimaris TaxID=2306023 RepID=A0A398BPT3_9RHOB|nr:hypothetical protein [Gemmobacter lutimaris]RID91557.1 hypothetical protein D2N39_12715 [Gemmobacter lutimaris]
MADAFLYNTSGLESPASNAAAITPSDSVDLANVPRALYALTDGTVRVTMRGGGSPVTVQMIAGVPLPFRVTRVWATGTTATGIVGVW